MAGGLRVAVANCSSNSALAAPAAAVGQGEEREEMRGPMAAKQSKGLGEGLRLLF
jgi:hypothetical protein